MSQGEAPVTPKAPTGIAGLDEITLGGLPRGRATLIEGGPGSGKTVLGLQVLAHGARHCEEPGIFVAFEESSRQILRNVASFGWDLPALADRALHFFDAQPNLDLVQSGDFDLGGLLSALGARAAQIGARRIVLDAVDVMLALLGDQRAVRREVQRLHEWLIAQQMTAIITAKRGHGGGDGSSSALLDLLQFSVDCSLVLGHDIVEGISQRNLRVRKYRGTGFEENTVPFAIGRSGIEVAYTRGSGEMPALPSGRISSGVERLDTMMEGGYYRGASVLLTGSPGTAKTTLCGAFAEAAAARGDRTLFVSFDSPAAEVVRNLGSVGIDLRPALDSGLLRVSSERATSGSAEIHVMRIKDLAREHGAACVVVDPLSALAKPGNAGTSPRVAARLIDWSKTMGITLIATSLLEENDASVESTRLDISTIADTWIHLSYLVSGGERNRGISIIKSRGTSHSNQVRELVLSRDGIALADVYTAEGEVLMGTLRWAKERSERLARQERIVAAERRRRHLESETAELQGRLLALQRALDGNRAELAQLATAETAAEDETVRAAAAMRRRRGADDTTPASPGPA
jgi:circadian clock protein KaiC